MARQHHESSGEGLTGMVGDVDVVVGSRAFVARQATTSLDVFDATEDGEAGLRAYVLLSGKPAGIIEYADSLRPELKSFLTTLRQLGLSRTVLLSGDRAANARVVGLAAGIKEAYGELLPADKAMMVSRFRARGEVVLMVGDGTNDAPALSAADGGVLFDAWGGALNRIPKGATAFVHRDSRFLAQYFAAAAPGVPAAVSKNRSWLREAHAAIHAEGNGEAYQNYIDPELDGWESAYFGDNLARLRHIKSVYDPDDAFRFPQSITPAI